MKNNLSLRDFKNLSAYLDGELNTFSSSRMKNRLARDPNLRAALETLRETKNILQRTPKRRAPRNFTLSPQMVAKSPPMPRMVPALNYATAFAMIIFFFSILPPFGIGAGAPAAPEMMQEASASFIEEAPAEEEVTVGEALEEAPALAESAPMMDEIVEEELDPNALMQTEETTADNQMTKDAPIPTNAIFAAPPASREIPESLPQTSFTLWQEILLAATIFFAVSGFVLRRKAMAKWE